MIDIKINTEGDLINIANKLDDALQAFCNVIKNAIVLNRLSGNPVHRRTGNLANSINYAKITNGKYEVGSMTINGAGLPYAYYLEHSPRFVKYRWLVSGAMTGIDEAKEQFDLILGAKK
jgi:hypothetical protein